MRLAGWSLIVAAVLMHFSACEWDVSTDSRSIVPFLPFHAREQFCHTSRAGSFCDTVDAGLWGLVFPLGLAVGGVLALGKANRSQLPSMLRTRIGIIVTATVLLAIVSPVLISWGLRIGHGLRPANETSTTVDWEKELADVADKSWWKSSPGVSDGRK